ncbi:hypothetical protein RF11_13653 [Thelohanellus kitauei]|uniref:Uncharacterized protein n=1 Tax=Thelohanellus kitauei TaxID=669202 RepID=A0A0C2N3P7_THEKT|nr:hypothetical protein RF11_06940 [Thelohanellus kitauei]KII73670.1 hypothetical protein RF11_13653 [Thelohanellus kitauei]
MVLHTGHYRKPREQQILDFALKRSFPTTSVVHQWKIVYIPPVMPYHKKLPSQRPVNEINSKSAIKDKNHLSKHNVTTTTETLCEMTIKPTQSQKFREDVFHLPTPY